MISNTFGFVLASLVRRTVPGVFLMLCLIITLPVHASETATNTSGLSLSVNVSSDDDDKDVAGKATNFFGLPKEAFDKLSSTEIMELVKTARSSQGRNNNFWKGMENVIIPLGLFSMIVLLVFIGGIQRLKRQRLLHETIRMMIEKGQPIPPELLTPDQRMRRPRNDLRSGLSMIGVGTGLTLLMIINHGRQWPLGLIPLLIGVAFLVTWKLEQNKPPGH